MCDPAKASGREAAPSAGLPREPRSNRTALKKRAMLTALGEGLSIREACKVARVGRRTYYDWRRDDRQFAADADDALADGTDRLEEIARERAKAYSDVLLMFLMKARAPERYRDNYRVRHEGPVAWKPDGEFQRRFDAFAEAVKERFAALVAKAEAEVEQARRQMEG